jgi:hypothetical protein
MGRCFLPASDGQLLSWSINALKRLSEDAGAFGVSMQQLEAFQQAQEAYALAYHRATQPGTRTVCTVQGKNDARKRLKEQARLISRTVHGAASVSNEQKTLLGLSVRGERRRIRRPSAAPGLWIEWTQGRLVRVRLGDAEVTRRGRPPGVQGARVMTHVGDQPPETLSQWNFERNTTQLTYDLLFPPSLEPGTKVWICAAWFNPRSEEGPACEPRMTQIGFGGSVQPETLRTVLRSAA